MDWTPFISGILVLLGTISGIIGSVIVQRIIQRNENTRHARALAYDAGLKEWIAMREIVFRKIEQTDKVQSTGGNIDAGKTPFPILEDYIIHHLAFSDLQGRITFNTGAGELEEYVIVSRERAERLFALRKKIDDERRDREASNNSTRTKENS